MSHPECIRDGSFHFRLFFFQEIAQRMWSQLQQHPPSPLVELPDYRWQAAGVRLLIKRDDYLAPAPGDPFCGNKWRKLKYNLLHAREQPYNALLSFGGAYSNHIAALASAGRWLGYPTIGVIRGEEVHNHTLSRAREDGMQLIFVSRTDFRAYSGLADYWQQRFPGAYVLPEGGSNELALPGCAELAQEVYQQLGDCWPTVLAVACGTGGTLTGMARGIRPLCGPQAVGPKPQLMGVSVLKGRFMTQAVHDRMATLEADTCWPHWHIEEDFHQGGYAKTTPALLHFMAEMEQLHGLLLDPVYTSKLLFGLFSLLAQGRFEAGSTVVAVHSGGLQGRMPVQ